ncbi:MAG: anti-sigma factor [Ignavibacteriales bacterium]|nr:anti-sigma factor [Ignavibacteriales bacterium]
MTTKAEERHAQLELCTPYVFGRLNPGNRKQFEAHLAAGCEQCRVELSGLYEATALLPLTLKQEAPSSGVRQTLLDRIASIKPDQQAVDVPQQQRSERPQPQRGERSQQQRGERPQQQRGERSQQQRGERPQQQRGERSQQQRGERPQQQREKPATPSLRPERPWYLYASIVTGVLLIAALFVFLYQLIGTAGAQEKRISELQSAIGILQAEHVEILELAGIVPGAAMYGKVLWDPAKRNAVLQTSNLPMQPEGKQYQFWILKDKKFYSVGLFDVTSEKSSTLHTMSLPVSDTKEIEGFSVTLEPKGGSPQPTGAMQLRVSAK